MRTEAWTSPAGKREFVPVQLTGTPAEGYRAAPGGGSLLTAMAKANALVVVPQDVTEVSRGAELAALVLEQ